MKRSNILALLLAVLAIIIIGLGYVYYQSTQPKPSTSNSSLKLSETTTTNLSQYNGLGGNKCLVKVDGKIYDATNNREWKNGEHSKSQGLAKCGMELSEVIKKSPHGKRVLDELPEVK
jgi:predicted heme/steroid binding protein